MINWSKLSVIAELAVSPLLAMAMTDNDTWVVAGVRAEVLGKLLIMIGCAHMTAKSAKHKHRKTDLSHGTKISVIGVICAHPLVLCGFDYDEQYDACDGKVQKWYHRTHLITSGDGTSTDIFEALGSYNVLDTSNTLYAALPHEQKHDFLNTEDT